MTESISAPTTEAEKLRWRVLEAERPSIRWLLKLLSNLTVTFEYQL